MDWKLEDLDILNEKPVTFHDIGPRKKKLVIRPLYIHEYYDEFVPRFIVFINYMDKLSKSLALPDGKDWASIKKMKDIRTNLIKHAFSHKEVRSMWILILKKSGLLKFSMRYFERWITVGQLLESFLYVYKMNVDGVKKKLQIILGILERDRQPLPQCIQQSLTGGLRDKLKPRYPKLAN